MTRRVATWMLGLLVVFGAAAWSVGEPAQEAKPAETPIGPKWWPSEFGPHDERGAANRITPQKVLQAKQLIRKGEMLMLGRPYEHGMPNPGNRHYSITIPGSPTAGPIGKNRMVSHDEMISGELGQIGTQFDGLGHVGVRIGNEDYFYNGFKRSEFGKAYGLTKLGVEKVGPLFTRGVFLDIARVRKTKRLPVGYVITPDDLERALELADTKIDEGDVVLIRTGHSQLWMKDNQTYIAGEPGLGMAAAKWLTAHKIALVGADTWGIEVVPHEDKDVPFPVHQWNLTRNGVFHLENLDLEQLAAKKLFEFAFVYIPVPLKGATGSPGSPIAIW